MFQMTIRKRIMKDNKAVRFGKLKTVLSTYKMLPDVDNLTSLKESLIGITSIVTIV